MCDVLVDPGNCDITADVDFSMLQTVAKQQGVLHHGPMTQNEFLHKMGIRERMDVSSGNCLIFGLVFEINLEF